MTIWTYRLPLKSPLPLPGGKVLKEREGVLLHDPATGRWGDAAPLPGFSGETVEEVLEALKSGDGHEPPSLRFARECMACTDPVASSAVQLNALWRVGQEPLKAFLDRIRGWKAPCVKIKPGAEPDPDVWLQLLEQRPTCRLRLDPNRAWSPDDLMTWTQDIPRDRLEYVEEPLANLEAYKTLPDGHGVPLALDESLRERSPAEVEALKGVVALVMKPTLMGNASDRQPWMELATTKGWTITWSSSFESGVGLWHLARSAAGSGPAGLDTATAFTEDLVVPRPLVDSEGFISPMDWDVTKAELVEFL